jgi:hypothetical protein
MFLGTYLKAHIARQPRGIQVRSLGANQFFDGLGHSGIFKSLGVLGSLWTYLVSRREWERR